MDHLAFVFGMIGRLRAIELALHYDLRAAKTEREGVVVPLEVWAALMNAWQLAKGRAPIYPIQPI